MIVLTKKKIMHTVSIFMAVIFIFIFTFQIAKIDNTTVQTVSLPVSNKVIVLDAGHRSSR